MAAQLAPLVMIPVLGWVVYRRVRRQFGRQPFRPKGLVFRSVVLGIATVALVALAAMQAGMLLPIGVALPVGAAIAFTNLRLTRFEWTPEGDFYFPHPYVGAALSLLLVGRLLYRFAQLGGMSATGAASPPNGLQTPLTMGLLALLVGYYLTYVIGLMVVRHRHHRGS